VRSDLSPKQTPAMYTGAFEAKSNNQGMRRRANSHFRWYLTAWLFVLSAVAFLDRVNISIAGGSIAAAYGLSNIQLGWVFSAFLIGYALLQTPGGRLADRFGPRRVLAAGVIWWGIFTALTASLPVEIGDALLLLVSIRFLLGAGEAVMYPASNQFVARWIPEQERGIANGWIFAGVGAGAGLSPPLITFVMLHYGWRSSFWICAVIGFVAGAIWYLAARDRPEEHGSVSFAEREHIRQAVAGDASAVKDQALIPWTAILKSRDVLAVTVSYFSFGYVAWIFFSWFYIYLAQVRNLNLKASAFYATLPFLAMAVCCPIGGLVSDRLARTHGSRVGRCYLAAVVIAAAGVFLVFGAEAQAAPLASIVLAGGAGTLYLAQSSFWSVTARLAGRSSGSVSGFMNMGAQIGGATTASLTPAIAGRFGWTASFLAAAGLCVLGAAAWMMVDPERTLVPVPRVTSARTS
jgi:MFS transporter, ACS family, glucarate transporter